MDSSTVGPNRTSILFVCLGNICRSPMAEGVFRHLVGEAGLTDRFEIDSAGTGAWHTGEPPDPRSEETARRHGIDLTSTARQVELADFDRYDYVVAMDRENLRDLRALRETSGGDASLHLLREFDPDGTGEDVPDPYYGGPHGFESMYHMVRRSCEALLEHLRPDERSS